MTKKWFLALLVGLVAMASLVAGCGSSQSTVPSDQPTAGQPPSTPVDFPGTWTCGSPTITLVVGTPIQTLTTGGTTVTYYSGSVESSLLPSKVTITSMDPEANPNANLIAKTVQTSGGTTTTAYGFVVTSGNTVLAMGGGAIASNQLTGAIGSGPVEAGDPQTIQAVTFTKQ